jgi:hypothetical protein
MRRALVPAAIALAIGIVAPADLGAQRMFPPGPPSVFRAANQEAFVQLAGVPLEVHGRLVSLDERVTIALDGRTFSWSRAEVVKVDVYSGNNALRGATIGVTAAGLGCFSLCGLGGGFDRENHLLSAVAQHAAAGAVAGFFIGLANPARKTVYLALPGTLTSTRVPADRLPCPAAPLVLTATMPDIPPLSWDGKTWMSRPDYRALGDARCDAITFRRNYKRATGEWEPALSLAILRAEGGFVDLFVRLTAHNPNDGIDKKVQVIVEVLQNGRVVGASRMAIGADADRENTGRTAVRLRPDLLSPISAVTLRFTVTTHYE